MNKSWILLCTFLLLAGISNAQSSKKKDKKKKTEKSNPRFEQQGNSYAPFSPEETKEVVAPTKAKKSKKKKSAYDNFNITMDQKVGEFNERMEANIKSRKKQARQMDKPQYSDPSYFGHKRKPKIRKVKNRKLCKECGITH
jgi:uncharacterized protein (DUF608 family)